MYFQANIQFLSLRRYIKSADKVYLKAQGYDLEDDEESAYVFYMRYFNIISLIKKSRKYTEKKVSEHVRKTLKDDRSMKSIIK